MLTENKIKCTHKIIHKHQLEVVNVLKITIMRTLHRGQEDLNFMFA